MEVLLSTVSDEQLSTGEHENNKVASRQLNAYREESVQLLFY